MKKRKSFKGLKAAVCAATVFGMLIFLVSIFPMSDGEQRLWVHERKLSVLLNVFGKCEVSFAGNSVQIEYGAFDSEKIPDEKLMSELRLYNPGYDDKQLAAYFAVYSAFMYLSERSVGEDICEITCRVDAGDGAEAAVVRQTKEEFHAAYLKSPYKTSRNDALLGCVSGGILAR